MFDLALKRIFLDVNEFGFWDSKNGRIHSKLEHNNDWQWKVSQDQSDRYGVFTLSAILLAKYLYGIELKNYNNQILSYLNYINNNIKLFPKSTITYGACNSLIFGKILYNDTSFDKNIDCCINYLMNKLKKINDNHDSLILIGLSCYLKNIEYKDNVANYLKHLVKGIISSQTKDGFFLTGDLRPFHHQRSMYVIWGLAFASEHYPDKNLKNIIKRTLDYVWNFRRDRQDNAFSWHPKFYFVRSKSGLHLPILLPQSANYLFECHQTFFVNAVKIYSYFFNDNSYDKMKDNALEWIFGNNRKGIDLRTVTGIDLPARIMTTDGKFLVRKNKFKGSYEVGSYILALI